MNSPGLIVSTRLVPRASGLAEHVSAEAWTDTPAKVQTNNATVKRIERLAPIYEAATAVFRNTKLLMERARWTRAEERAPPRRVSDRAYLLRQKARCRLYPEATRLHTNAHA